MTGLARSPSDTATTLAPTVPDLLARATSRVRVRPADARSGATFEHVEIEGERYFLKVVDHTYDWIMRVTGDRDYRTLKTWQAGIMAQAPVDHTIVAASLGPDGLSILMRDVTEHVVPAGDEPLDPAVHQGFLDALAAMCVTFRGWRDGPGLTSMAERFRFFAPATIAPELAGEPDVVLQLAHEGWGRLAERRPDLSALVTAVHERPEPLVAALAATPTTFLHGDWKLGNLGRRPDGRVVLLDWAYPGEGPPCWDLLWYVALNQARLPQDKHGTIAAFRDALDRAGWPTAGWFDRQLALTTVGMAACFGWEKALGDDAELDWWADAALAGARVLDDRAPGG